MPTSPPHPCNYPSCNTVVPYGQSRCAAHTALRPDHRPNANKRGYTAEWNRISRKYKRDHPFCEICEDPADEVHHKIPIAQGGTHEKSNLIALCKRCHYRAERAA